MLKNKEFYTTPQGDAMIEGEDGTHILSASDRVFISKFIVKVQEFWPWSLPPLHKKFEKLQFNIPLYEFRIVRHWIKCNLGNYDSVLDIDDLGNFNLEVVICPLRGGDCPMENIVCKPKFNSKLSDRELETMQLFYESNSPENIAEKLLISVETVKTHKRNAFRRVDVHSLAEFFTYAKQHNLFKN